MADINPEQIWFQHVGNNLEVSIIGTQDKLIIKDWYQSSDTHVEQFETAGGLRLSHSQIENLVIAMASHEPPGLGQTTLPSAYEISLDPLISALWL